VKKKGHGWDEVGEWAEKFQGQGSQEHACARVFQSGTWVKREKGSSSEDQNVRVKTAK
jgi:hypothetical protein